MNAGEFARRLRADSELPDKRFAFFLGAGCSISSGIPGTSSLVKDHWLPRLRTFRAPDSSDFDEWIKEEFPEYEPNNPGGSYGAVMEHLFLNAEDRQREIERLCDGKFPGFGYAVLATLIAKYGGYFNVVITTNFDDLVSDALYLFTRARPLVIGHESLAGYIRPTRTRPLVVKIHGDARLSPQNTIAETANIQKEVERQVNVLLYDRAPIFIGYGGNDKGIATMLAGLSEEALPFGIYWVSGSEPQGALRPWLEERNAIWVEKFDFDEMMLLFRDAFDLPHPDIKQVESIFQLYGATYEKLSGRIRSAPVEIVDEALKKAIDRADSDTTGWLSVAIEANRFEKSNPDKADEIYQKGLDEYSQSPSLLGSYAIFLKNIRKDYDKSEQFYLRALDANPNDAINLGNYANFLADIHHDHDKAEQFYLRALDADPNDANNLGNYAVFLKNIRKDYDKSEQFYLRALDADPNNAINLGNYANFLKDIHHDHDQAEQFYLRALDADPNDANNLGNYAGLVLSRGNVDQGNKLLDKAISLLPDPAVPSLAVELWFYAFCHWPENKHVEALKNLKMILLGGNRSLDWDLSQNIERARQDNHPNIKWLEILADVITKDVDLKKLDDWQKWKEI
jgi:protein O-mannosyl-transferase